VSNCSKDVKKSIGHALSGKGAHLRDWAGMSLAFGLMVFHIRSFSCYLITAITLGK
jgi:hypothetical protein